MNSDNLNNKPVNTQPIDESKQKGKLEQAKDSVMGAFQANPGPVIPKELNVAEEGTKEERRAKAAEMNK